MVHLPPDFLGDFDGDDDVSAVTCYPTLTAAIYAKLAADSTLAGLIASYDPLGAGPPAPAIFTDPIPEGAQAPFVVLMGEIGLDPFDDNESSGSSVLYDVQCYDTQAGSRVLIGQIGARIRALLHNQPLSICGLQHVLTAVSGPIRNDSIDLVGSVLTARVLLSE